MCGIAGFWRQRGAGEGDEGAIARAMAGTLAPRGPDAEAVWCDSAAGIGLGHRRLAVVDLSPAGVQPMTSADGRWVVVYNGELYNARELRRDLERDGVRFRGGSDTEVLLEGCAHWGVGPALARCRGMFALALWDRQGRSLHLARDRRGIKPLYWGWCGATLLFGSQLKALAAHPAWEGELDRDSLAEFVRFSYVSPGHSIYRRFAQLSPGEWLRIAADGRIDRGTLPEVAVEVPDGVDERALLERLDQALQGAVARQMVADVLLGAFLSGGIDSSLLVALMRSGGSGEVRTFSIGFGDPAYNEAHYARRVADHLGSEHTEYYVDAAEALRVIPELPEHFDEPFGDASLIPTYILSALARGAVTVALAGDGGDELFGGYDRYRFALRAGALNGHLPRPLRAALAGLLRAVPIAAWERLLRLVPNRRPQYFRGDKVHRIAELLDAGDAVGAFAVLGAESRGGEAWVPGGWAGRLPRSVAERHDPDRLLEWMMEADLAGYLPGDILVKSDRASMAHGLEVRVPLLDDEVVALARRLPVEMKIRGRESKWALRRLLERHLPRELIERPKMGFSVPIGDWLRGPLREWAGDLLSAASLAESGLFDAKRVTTCLEEHLAGRRDAGGLLWNLLAAQAWWYRWAAGGRQGE